MRGIRQHGGHQPTATSRHERDYDAGEEQERGKKFDVRGAELTRKPEQNSAGRGAENQPSTAAQLDIDDGGPEKEQDRGNLQGGIDSRDLTDCESSLATSR